MATRTLEERVEALEQELAQLKQLQARTLPAPLLWWEQIFGTFANSEAHEEATRLGREYRESLRPKGDDDILALVSQVYDGLSEQDVNEVEQIALDRSAFFTRPIR